MRWSCLKLTKKEAKELKSEIDRVDRETGWFMGWAPVPIGE